MQAEQLSSCQRAFFSWIVDYQNRSCEEESSEWLLLQKQIQTISKLKKISQKKLWKKKQSEAKGGKKKCFKTGMKQNQCSKLRVSVVFQTLAGKTARVFVLCCPAKQTGSRQLWSFTKQHFTIWRDTRDTTWECCCFQTGGQRQSNRESIFFQVNPCVGRRWHSVCYRWTQATSIDLCLLVVNKVKKGRMKRRRMKS